MNNPKDAAEGSETCQKAFTAQFDYLFRGSAGKAASQIRGIFQNLSYHKEMREYVPKERKPELFRQRMVQELETTDSDFFRLMTQIATAVNAKDSGFFRKIADGLDNILLGRKDDAMPFLSHVYFFWMYAGTFSRIVSWKLPAYQWYIDNGIEPTKQQMRELTQRFWAVERLHSKNRILHCLPEELQSPEIEALIAEEIKGLNTQKWPRLWEAAGLTHLKSGRPGRKPQ